MSIFLAFSLQKRLEHILNSMPGFPPPLQPLKIFWHAVISLRTRRWERGRSCLACPNCHTCWGLLSSCEVNFGSALLGGLDFGQDIQTLPFLCVNPLVFLLVLPGGSQLEDEGFLCCPPSLGWPMRGSRCSLRGELQEEPGYCSLHLGTAIPTAIIHLNKDVSKDRDMLPATLPNTDTDKQLKKTQQPLIVIVKEDPTWPSHPQLSSSWWREMGSSRVTFLPYFSDPALRSPVFLLTLKGAPMNNLIKLIPPNLKNSGHLPTCPNVLWSYRCQTSAGQLPKMSWKCFLATRRSPPSFLRGKTPSQ